MILRIKNKLLKWLPAYGLIVLLLSFYFLDAVNKYFFITHQTSFFVATVKSVLLLMVFGVMLFIKPSRYFVYGVVILTSIFIVGQLTHKQPFLYQNVLIFLKWMAPLFLIETFNNIHPSLKQKQTLFRVFEVVLAINGIIIIIGVLFNIKLFQSYFGSRFGYNGLFFTPGVTSYIYILALAYYYFSNNIIKNWKFWVFFLSCFLVGTKLLYLAIILFILAILKRHINISLKKIIPLGVLLICVIGYFFFFKTGYFANITQQHDFVTSLLSFRDQLFLNNTMPYIKQNWGVINYLFGGVINFDIRSQMEIVDVFLYWGVAGGVLFYYFFYKLYLNKVENLQFYTFLVMYSLLFFITGNFFTYISIFVYLLLLRLLFTPNTNIVN